MAFFGDVVTGGTNSTPVSSLSEGSEWVVEAGGRVGEGGKGIEAAVSISSGPLEAAGRGSGRLHLSAALVEVATPVRVDFVESALDGGRVGLGMSILEGGRAVDVVRARLLGGAKDTSFVFSV